MAIKGCTWSDGQWHSTNDWLALRGPQCAKKIFSKPLQHHQSGLLTQSRLGQWINAKVVAYQETSWSFPTLLLFLLLTDRSGTWRGVCCCHAMVKVTEITFFHSDVWCEPDWGILCITLLVQSHSLHQPHFQPHLAAVFHGMVPINVLYTTCPGSKDKQW